MFQRRPESEFVIERLTDETLVYDLKRHKAHCLKPAAAMVWEHCDGKTTKRALAALLRKELGIDADVTLVRAVLVQLQRVRLLAETPGATKKTPLRSRRELMKKLVLRGLPAALVLSITAPTPAQAATVLDKCCTTQADCPLGLTCQGPGAGHPCIGCVFKCCH
jgi:diphthamide synthase (EF-2-diphthine--ammonia ligase)